MVRIKGLPLINCSSKRLQLAFNKDYSMVLVFLDNRLFLSQKVLTFGALSQGSSRRRALLFVVFLLWRFGLVRRRLKKSI